MVFPPALGPVSTRPGTLEFKLKSLPTTWVQKEGEDEVSWMIAVLGDLVTRGKYLYSLYPQHCSIRLLFVGSDIAIQLPPS